MGQLIKILDAIRREAMQASMGLAPVEAPAAPPAAEEPWPETVERVSRADLENQWRLLGRRPGVPPVRFLVWQAQRDLGAVPGRMPTEVDGEVAAELACECCGYNGGLRFSPWHGRDGSYHGLAACPRCGHALAM